jgi:hypothetical protein
MPDLDPATVFAPRFNALGAPWAATGSIASTFYGEVRSTNDIDIIVLLDGPATEALPRVFPETEFYCPPRDVIEIERNRERRGHFNLVPLRHWLEGRRVPQFGRSATCVGFAEPTRCGK